MSAGSSGTASAPRKPRILPLSSARIRAARASTSGVAAGAWIVTRISVRSGSSTTVTSTALPPFIFSIADFRQPVHGPPTIGAPARTAGEKLGLDISEIIRILSIRLDILSFAYKEVPP